MPAGATYEPLATSSSLSGNSSFSFTSISSSYTDLILIVFGSTTTGNSVQLRFNSDTGSNYSLVQMQGNGSTPTTSRETALTGFNVYGGFGTTTATMYRIQIFNYTSTSANKTILSEGAIDKNGSGIVNRVAGSWRNYNTAITSISGELFAGTFNSGSTATLYGIKNSA